MTPPVVDVVADGVGSLREGAERDPRGLWRFLTIVGVVAVLSALVYLLSTRTVTEDRYTGTDARRDKAAVAEQRSSDLRDQEKVNSLWRESNAAIRATLDALDSRTRRIESKLDAK